ncbi:MAG: helix-turn-helix transcriptional regulator [Synergistaceae bacterium]|jgi:DNA-binding CsgD family transcriptional regulator|nr:helix-turn-helix transcriptional regulator [Synergistaceae bacterium]
MLESFRFCHLRLSLWMAGSTGLAGRENIIFMVYCLGIVAGMTVVPSALRRLDAGRARQSAALALQALAFLAIPCVLAGYFSNGGTALLFQFLADAAMAGSMSVCLNRAATGGVPPERIGRFTGLYISAAGLVTIALFFLPGVAAPTGVILAAVCCLPAIAAAAFGRQWHTERALETAEPEPLPRGIMLKTVVVIGLSVVVSGILDNIFFFESAFAKIPHLMFFTLAYGCVTVVVAGHVCDKVKWAPAATVSLLLVCLGQSMSFFSDRELLVYPYAILTNAGNVAIEVFLTAIPVAYCARYGKGKFSAVPGLGYAGLYGGFLVTSFAFEFVPEEFYKTALGVTLIVALTAMYVVLTLGAEYDRFLYERAAAKNPSAADYGEKMGFTAKEREVMGLLASGMATAEIARRMFISERTVNFHLSSMFKKTGSKSRIELIAKASRPADFEHGS